MDEAHPVDSHSFFLCSGSLSNVCCPDTLERIFITSLAPRRSAEDGRRPVYLHDYFCAFGRSTDCLQLDLGVYRRFFPLLQNNQSRYLGTVHRSKSCSILVVFGRSIGRSEEHTSELQS